MFAELIIIILGVWLIISPFVLDIRGLGRTADIIVGAAVALVIIVDMIIDSRKGGEE